MTEPNQTTSSSNESCTDVIIHLYNCTKLENADKCLLKNSAVPCAVLFICTLGLIGNGTVFWLLGFRIKRNFFSIYVLNLAVADFGVLIAVWSLYICIWSRINSGLSTSLSEVYDHLIHLFFFMQYSSIHFLTAISVDRCLVIFFPVWHRCHRPKNLSAIVSSVLWGISGVFLGMIIFSSCWEGTNTTIKIFFMVCASIMVISTAILFFKVCCNSRLRQHGKVHVVILLSLIFFIIMTIPIILFVTLRIDGIAFVSLLLICLNSSSNPFIYFIVGRCRSFGQSRIPIKDMLLQLFKEEGDSGNEAQSSNLNSPLMSALWKIRPSGSVLFARTSSSPPMSPMEEFHVS